MDSGSVHLPYPHYPGDVQSACEACAELLADDEWAAGHAAFSEDTYDPD